MSEQSISLRTAVPADIATLRCWHAQPHIEAATGRAPGEPGAWDWENEISQVVPWREMLIAECLGRPIGFVQIIDPAEDESQYWGDCAPDLRAIDIWIGEPAFLGGGFGTQIMSAALERCFAVPPVRAVLIDPLAANIRAIEFYTKMGFRVLGRRMFGEDDCLVMRIDRASYAVQRRKS